MKKLRLAAVLIFTIILAACATTPPPPPPQTTRPKVALVLSGGAARGFAHVGVIRALEQEKIPIDLIVGTSVGSLIGAIYAHDRNSFELEWTAFTLYKDSIFDYGLFTAFTGMGLAKGEKLEDFVRTKIPTTNIEDLKIPYAAVATDLNLGERVVLTKGSVVKAVHASSAIPGVFEPVLHQGHLLVDGGVTDNIPIDVARELGADIVIAVDISEVVENHNITNLVDVMLQSVNIMFNENVLSHKHNADVLITPAVGKVAMLDFTQKKQCMLAGIEATQKMIPELKAKMADWRPTTTTPRKSGS